MISCTWYCIWYHRDVYDIISNLMFMNIIWIEKLISYQISYMISHFFVMIWWRFQVHSILYDFVLVYDTTSFICMISHHIIVFMLGIISYMSTHWWYHTWYHGLSVHSAPPPAALVAAQLSHLSCPNPALADTGAPDSFSHSDGHHQGAALLNRHV